jgi:hypothetical protein
MSNQPLFPTKMGDVPAFCFGVLAAGKKYIKELPFADDAFWTLFESYINKFVTAVNALEVDKYSQSLLLQRNVARDWLKDAVHRIHEFVKGHPFTTDEILHEFGFAVPKKVRTRATVPTDSVEATFTKHKTASRHICKFRILGSDSRGCGGLYDRVELRIFVGKDDQKPPANPEDYPRREELRKSPEEIEFPPEQAGLIAYYAARFINSVGEEGPWAILEAERIP